uniref:Uncharacterized protein n=1 Tax=Lactuca sativa TaxID=4236 RepID=A0A9R1X6P9_LACSA|nr:hypothetical protein LSAT_V11C600329410 [Lactuca sativa]
MDPNQNNPPPPSLNFRNCKPDNAFALDTTPRQFPTMESLKGGFFNLLQTAFQKFQQLQQQQFQPQPSQPPHLSDFVSKTQPSPPPQPTKKEKKPS